MNGQAELTPSIADSPWQWWREQMPVANEWAYLDHAAVAPISRSARDAIRHFAEQAAEFGDVVWPEWTARLETLRGQFATLLNCDRREIVIVPNTSAGVSLVAEGWHWQPGDSIVVPEGEFPSNLFPWQNQQARGVELRVVPRREGRVVVDDLIAHVDASTRIIATSWVGYSSGYRVDLDRLVDEAHRRGVLVFLDAIQGLGPFSLDLSQTPIDFLAADGHKWLLGPEGCGVAVVRTPHIDRLRCGNIGWNSVQNRFDYAQPKLELRNDAARFEAGSMNLLGVAALSASLEMFLAVREHHGPDAIAKRVTEQVRRLDDQLRGLGATTSLPEQPEHQSGILTFTLPTRDPREIRKQAANQKVVVSCRDGRIRASVHAYNDQSDLERLVEVCRG